MLKRLILAFFLVCAPLGVTACASLGSAFEQVQPRTVREGLALAEVSYVGAIKVAQDMHAAGILSSEDARNEVLPVLEQVAVALDTAHAMLRAGDEAAAGNHVNAALNALQVLSAELQRRADERNRAKV